MPKIGERFAVMIGNDEHGVTALCNDGTIWRRGHVLGSWQMIENVPQPEPDEPQDGQVEPPADEIVPDPVQTGPEQPDVPSASEPT